MRIIIILFISLNFYCIQFSQAQNELFQTIRGSVNDKTTLQPLIGVSIVVTDITPFKYAITNNEGKFTIENVIVGRHDIKATYVGYLPVVINNLMIVSAKEVVLNIEMEESVETINEIVVKNELRKDMPKNTMATVSARQFTIEETNRFAGSFGDISRMVVNYAGVTAISNQRNDIIIRGNNPMGLLWKVEDIDIPNPNHFGSAGSSGGAFTIVNNNVLKNSDFFTGAFPSNYGNALSGVFDLQLRNGNNTKREYTIQAGYNGLETGFEGPILSNSKASLLFNYRLSTLQAINSLGIKLNTLPEYQDITFKFIFPTSKGSFSIFGIGGLSSIAVLESNKPEKEWTYKQAAQDAYVNSDMGVLGIKFKHNFNNETRGVFCLAMTIVLPIL